MTNPATKTALAFILAGFAGTARAQFTYPNCAATADKDFSVTTVISRTNSADIYEPLKMDFQMDAQGNVNIFFIERKGAIKYYDALTKAVRVLGNIPNIETGGEDGLVGFALDPAFKDNKRLFTYYASKLAFRISRFNLDPATLALKPETEKILLEIPSSRGRWHTSGAMRFDAYGDLWINAGDNETLLQGPANTASLRGSILRIHPTEAGGYTIPAGNLWETSAKLFDDKGMGAVAAKYRDSTKAKREVFVKGIRNAYTLTLDPVRRWAVWGDCGPDQQPGNTPDSSLWTEEHNVATTSGFYGWPFWTAVGHVQDSIPYKSEPIDKANWADWKTLKPDAPINPLPGVAIPELPPARTGTHSYAHSCAMTGPIYRYDGAIPSSSKLPPSLNRVWFVTDFNKGAIQAIRLTPDGKQNGAAVDMFKGLSPNFNKPLDFQAGPDGALYYLNYSCGTWYTADACTGIYRIDYKGTCQDPTLKAETASSFAYSMIKGAHGPAVEIDAGRIIVSGKGGYGLALYDMSGKAVRSFSSEGPKEYRAASLLAGAKPGIYFVKVSNDQGEFTGKVRYFP
ncbi:MAG: soluble aldose sugar dehydrogenase YliI [Fibrobacteres bacterium]|nr:soluble aldose sugar dehydrogenase YliI [Fibrobacterota bacterium]